MHLYGVDQDILANVVYSKYKDGFLIHSSYNCELFRDSVPFPVQRSNVTGKAIEYIGMPMACMLRNGTYEFVDGAGSMVYGNAGPNRSYLIPEFNSQRYYLFYFQISFRYTQWNADLPVVWIGNIVKRSGLQS